MAGAWCRAGLSVIAIVMVLGASPAHADRPRERARTLFRAGKVAYAAARYDEAARLFSAGYAIDPAPAFLLNIAQSYRSAGKLKLALEHYRRYIEAAPKTQLRSQVDDLIRDLEERIAKATRAREGAMEPPAASLPSSRPAPPDTSTRPFYRSWWFWTVVGAVAVTGAGLGAYYGTREPSYLKEGGLGAVRW